MERSASQTVPKILLLYIYVCTSYLADEVALKDSHGQRSVRLGSLLEWAAAVCRIETKKYDT